MCGRRWKCLRQPVQWIFRCGDLPNPLVISNPSFPTVRPGKAFAPPVDETHLYTVVDVLEAVAEEAGKSVPQVAINWLLQRPTVSSVIVGARNEEQLRQNLGSVGWSLTADQVAALDAASDVLPPYPHTPYRQQDGFARLNPPPV